MRRLQQMMFSRGLSCLPLAFCVSMLAIAHASAQDIPDPDGDPVNVSGVPGDKDGNKPEKAGFVFTPGYRSEMLGGTFEAQWMKLTKNGRSVVFWGARIIELDQNSPLHALRLQEQDVVSTSGYIVYRERDDETQAQ